MTDTQWFSAESDRVTAKLSLKIDADDTNYDSRIDEYGKKANRKIDNVMHQYINTTPSLVNDITEDLKGAAILYIQYRWWLDETNYDLANAINKEFKDTLQTSVARLIGEKTDRTEAIFVTDKNPLDATYQPYNIDEHIARVF